MRLIPNPKQLKMGQGYCSCNGFELFVTKNFKDDTTNLVDYLSELFGDTKDSDNAVKIVAEYNPDLDIEEYKLSVEEKSITITSSTSAGFFYALQTLRQSMYKDESGEFQIPLMVVNDAPRFEWRGLHIDVCRHFFSIDFIKKQLDLMAMYKLNKFHWHLTEDQGWRIEIKKYPLLTSKSAWRTEKDGTQYGGFYTQEEIKEVVAYAGKLQIEVIPEIELPGHALAALASYPQYSCIGGPFEVIDVWGVTEDVYCAGKDDTFDFLNDIISEVCELFPSKYFHIGGDGCPKTRWHECPDCQNRMKTEGLADEKELQSWFIRQIEKTLIVNGKTLIGWDEILEGGLADSAIVMSWQGIEGGIQAVKQGNKAIMTPWANMYFDKRPYPEDTKVDLPILTWEDVYNYEPIPAGLSAEEAKLIMGAQANIWTEHIYTEEEFQYMLIPRIFPLAEILWTTPENKDIESFRWLLKRHMEYLIRRGYNFAHYREEILNK
ncbi:MAG: beta-N-acetylhexosaminidase [Candidatus Zophobacter franzmannii]|nr:beta-N-acetylhexosaminidase [Candidatus Zophobacter franzmannii]